jgi:Family of unknown function (DUF6893)
MTLTVNNVQNNVNNVLQQSDVTNKGAGGTDMTRSLFVVAAAVGLGAVLARSVVPDVTRYLRIRRM